MSIDFVVAQKKYLVEHPWSDSPRDDSEDEYQIPFVQFLSWNLLLRI